MHGRIGNRSFYPRSMIGSLGTPPISFYKFQKILLFVLRPNEKFRKTRNTKPVCALAPDVFLPGIFCYTGNMEFGYTIPLQKRVGIKGLRYGAEVKRIFCWDLHVICLHGREALLAVHCASRYAVVLAMGEKEWARLPETALGGIRAALAADGFAAAQVETYIECAGKIQVTRTHGRREVAFLNRAWDDVAAQDWLFDPEEVSQFLLDYEVNGSLCRCAGYAGLGRPRERMAEELSVFT